MTPAKTVCIFCGAHTGNSESIVSQARELSALLAVRGYDLVYGGGNSGLMGIVANTFLEAGRKVVGIRPEKLIKDEFAHPGIHELIVVKDMHERKLKMIEAADIFISLPGGAGTLDEMIEVFTQIKIGFVKKACAVLNTERYKAGVLQRIGTLLEDLKELQRSEDAVYGSEENYDLLQAKGFTAYVKYLLWYQEHTGPLSKRLFASHT